MTNLAATGTPSSSTIVTSAASGSGRPPEAQPGREQGEQRRQQHSDGPRDAHQRTCTKTTMTNQTTAQQRRNQALGGGVAGTFQAGGLTALSKLTDAASIAANSFEVRC